MKCNINIEPLVISSIPNTWGNWYNYRSMTESHYEHGWRDYVMPTTDHNEKLGDLYYDIELDIVTNEVIILNDQEITEELIQSTEHTRNVFIKKLMEKEVIAKIQLLEGDEALEVKDAYPFWEVGIEIVTGQKYQAISPDLDEMWLWEVITGHTTQEGWMPKDTPALFKRVGFEGEILVWVEPTGAHDAYNIGDKVKYPTAEDDIWESKVNGNIYAPGVVPGQWVKL